MDAKKTCDRIVKGIKGYFKENNFRKAVIGLSGGIDSAVACALTVKAIGRGNVVAILMPEKGVSSIASVEDAKKLCAQLKIRYHLVPINTFLTPYKKFPWGQSLSSTINTKARVRANILYHYANKFEALVIGTSNKTEIMLGYFTKHGDGAVDVEVIGGLYKTEVYSMAEHINIPIEIIKKKPSAELFSGHTDENELGAGYPKIDAILRNFARKHKPSTPFEKELMKRIKSNEHKRKLPETIR